MVIVYSAVEFILILNTNVENVKALKYKKYYIQHCRIDLEKKIIMNLS